MLMEQGRKLYIDAGKDLKIHKISKRVTLLILLRKIELEMLPHLKSVTVQGSQCGGKLICEERRN